ncbi:protein KINESIN LIGHT CHAIN-RELATED 2-like [Corylus avellana]|uniref:protein KINESIN LIGHT CHAIN-RELATED 2-like n=1 Tax=Corylus avellana TaxID=13451 RepID=UPI001E2094E0|nr:protein KINESIN LIGHT CHAIN-RELATED 2-like [Corylus avellana]
MRKNPISLLLNLSRQGPKSFSPLIYRNYASPSSSSSSSAPLDSPALSRLWTRAHGLLLKVNKTTPKRFQKTESFVDKATQLLLRQRKLKEKCELEEAFESAKTKEEMLNAFKKMESAFDERELAPACLRIGLKLKEDGEDPKQIISFANRALRGFDKDDEPAFLLIAWTLHLLGSAKYDLGGELAFADGLQYIDRADRILGRLEKEGCSDEDFRPLLYAVQFESANLKVGLGWWQEVIAHLRKCLDIKEVISEKDGLGLGKANRYLAECYVAQLYFKEALPHCMKALEIHEKQLGQNSVEVASDRRLLGVIYTGLEEHEKALEQNELLRKVLKNLGLISDLLLAEIDAADMQIAVGKYETAINTLEGVVQLPDSKTRVLCNQGMFEDSKRFLEIDEDSKTRAFISMGKAFCNQGKFADSKRCLEIALGILEKKRYEKHTFIVDEPEQDAYSEIAMQYKTMNELETATSLLKKSKCYYEREGAWDRLWGGNLARHGWFRFLIGDAKNAVYFFDQSLSYFYRRFGQNHYVVGYIYNYLGVGYWERDGPEAAVMKFVEAKDILNAYLGPYHPDSIEASQNLSKAYGAIGRYALAIEFQLRVIDAWEIHCPELREARQLLVELKKKADGASLGELKKEADGAKLPVKA